MTTGHPFGQAEKQWRESVRGTAEVLAFGWETGLATMSLLSEVNFSSVSRHTVPY